MKALALLSFLLLSSCGALIADCEYDSDRPIQRITNTPCYRVAMNGDTGQAVHQIVVRDAFGVLHSQEVE